MPRDGAIFLGDLIGNSTCYTQLMKSVKRDLGAAAQQNSRAK
jgi:hypothetical protein